MKGKAGKVVRIIVTVLTYLLLAICLFALIVTIIAKNSTDGVATVFGAQLRIVQSSSMEKHEATDVSGYEIKELPVKTLVVVQVVPTDEAEADAWYQQLKKGDVITFQYVFGREAETVTHRLIADPEANENGGYTLRLQGDNRGGEYAEVGTQVIDTSDKASFNYVIGKVTWSSYLLGLLLYAMKTPVGVICIVILPCLIIIGVEIVRIVNVFTEEKRQKAEWEAREKETEIEELKRKLAELENANAPASTGADAQSNAEEPPTAEKTEEQDNG